MLMKGLTAVLVVTTIVGCATPGVNITVTSSPDGAYIISEGPVTGLVPVEAFWDKKTLDALGRDENGCFLLQGFTATWVSGAVTSVPILRHCDKSTDGNYNFVMSRDMNAPGLDKDLQFALQVQNLRVQKAQADAAQAMAYASMWSAARANQPKQQSINCSTYGSGNALYTNCR
jgi:hypothetical protein